MSASVLPNKEQKPIFSDVDDVDSDGSNSPKTFNALIAEGENRCDPAR